MSAHCAMRRFTSSVSCSSVAPSAAVRTMTPDVVGQHLLEDLLQARALGVGELAADAVHRAVRHVHEVAAGQRDLAREAGALVADRVLRDLHEHAVARLQRELDAAGLVLLAVLGGGVPVDLARVEHGVAAAADVDEGGLHARQHVLHAAEVDVADERRVLVAGDVVLDEHAVLEHADLDAAALLAHDHRAVDRLAAGEELGLGDHRAATTGVATVAAALLLRLESRRALDLLRLGDELGLAGLAHLDDGVGGLVGRWHGPPRRCGGGCGGARSTASSALRGRVRSAPRSVALASRSSRSGRSDRNEHRRRVEDQRRRRQRRRDRRGLTGSGAIGGRDVLGRRASSAPRCRGLGSTPRRARRPAACRVGLRRARRSAEPAGSGGRRDARARRPACRPGHCDRSGASAPGSRRDLARLARRASEQAAASLRGAAAGFGFVRVVLVAFHHLWCTPTPVPTAAPSSRTRLERSCAVRGTANPSLLRPAGCLCRHVLRCVHRPLRMRCILKAFIGVVPGAARTTPSIIACSHRDVWNRHATIRTCRTPPDRPDPSPSPSSS